MNQHNKKQIKQTILNTLRNYSTRTKIILVGSAAVVLTSSIAYLKGRKSDKSTDVSDLKIQRISNRDFFLQLKELIRIVLPGFRTKEFAILVLHTLTLVSKTLVSLYVAHLDGQIVKALVDRKGKDFVKRVFLWLGVAIPATWLVSQIKYLENKLSIAFRTRLTKYTYDLYMNSETYYRVTNLDSRLQNPDQCLTEDIANFCKTLAHVHSQLSKPILDIMLNVWQLSRLSRQAGHGSGLPMTILATAVIYITATILKWARPRFGKLVKEQAELEGRLRYVHSRLITNAEEIAFLGGSKTEKGYLMDAYLYLVKHMNRIFKARIFYTMLEGYLMKYVWNATGVSLIALPAFLYESRHEGVSGDVISSRTGSYITAKNLMLFGANAIERIMLAYKEIAQLAGYTQRVKQMIDVFKDVQQEKYQKKIVDSMRAQNITAQRGKVILGDFIQFENVPICSPNGDILVEKLSFKIQQGQHLLITGPNGCGKSSLFRILGELWPVCGGTVVKPPASQLYYIPQRPYLSMGNLRDQVIYPDTYDDMKAKGIKDEDLLEIFKWVNLVYVLNREGGWEAKNEWKDVLSGGEKQRIGMARLFYHKPKFALLDECTSAVSMDVEGKIYQHAIDIGITLLTITHRHSLWKYHNFILQFDGEGGVKFNELNADARMSLKEEKLKLETQLSSVAKMRQRLQTLCNMLGEDSVVLSDEKEHSKHRKSIDA